MKKRSKGKFKDPLNCHISEWSCWTHNQEIAWSNITGVTFLMPEFFWNYLMPNVTNKSLLNMLMQCSQTCGIAGIRLRQVYCYRDNQPSMLCSSSVKPQDTETCQLSSSCGQLRRKPGKWSITLCPVTLCKIKVL